MKPTHKKECTRKNRGLCECDPSSKSTAWRTESTHTPTPWGYVYDGSSDWSIGESSDPQGKFVANIWDKNDDRAQANAAFIVCAVNSYAELLEIAKWVADFDCEVECFNKAMETHPGVELCMPCRAREILGVRS